MLECRWMESEVIRDGWGHVGEVYHDIGNRKQTESNGTRLCKGIRI